MQAPQLTYGHGFNGIPFHESGSRCPEASAHPSSINASIYMTIALSRRCDKCVWAADGRKTLSMIEAQLQCNRRLLCGREPRRVLEGQAQIAFNSALRTRS